VRECRTLGPVRAKVEWLSYSILLNNAFSPVFLLCNVGHPVSAAEAGSNCRCAESEPCGPFLDHPLE